MEIIILLRGASFRTVDSGTETPVPFSATLIPSSWTKLSSQLNESQMLTVQLVKTAFAMGWEAQLVKLDGG